MSVAILILVQSLEKGGRTKRILQTRERLQALGHRVELAVMAEPPAWVLEQFELRDYQVFAKDKHSKYSLILSLFRYLKRQKIDLIHAHCEASFFYGGMAAKLGRIVIVGTYHRSDLRYYQSNLKNRFYNSLLNHCVAISTQRQRLMEESLGVSMSKITLIHGGADVREITPSDSCRRTEVRKALNIPKDSIAILSLGHLGEIKGHDDSIEALSLVAKQSLDINLYIGGDGTKTDYQRLQSLIAEKGLSSRVKLLGQLTNVVDWLHACDIFLQPSIEEGFGLVFAEAGAAGLPVLATNVGGIPDIVVDGETGILVEPREPQKLAQAIESIFCDKEHRELMGKRGRERIVRHFSLEAMGDQYDHLFRSLLN